MDKEKSLSLKLEFVWWIFTAIFAIGVLYPILSQVDHYPFLFSNLLFIIVFITFTRYIFLLKHTFLAKQQYLKVGIILISLPIIFYLGTQLINFQTYLDEEGLSSFLYEVEFENIDSTASYIRNQMMFFGAGSIIAAVIIPFRLVLSVWRTKNRGTV